MKKLETLTLVYGARCAWWDDISKVGRLTPNQGLPRHSGPGLPCCPHCQSVLYQVEEDVWWTSIDDHEREGHAGYRAFVKWLRGKCFPSYDHAYEVYQSEKKQG